MCETSFGTEEDRTMADQNMRLIHLKVSADVLAQMAWIHIIACLQKKDWDRWDRQFLNGHDLEFRNACCIARLAVDLDEYYEEEHQIRLERIRKGEISV
jgi:hypothetical protein